MRFLGVMLRSMTMVVLFGLIMRGQQPPPGSPTFGSASAAPAQSAPALRSVESRRADSEAQHHIVLHAVIRDASGNAVKHLAQSELSILDNSYPQPLRTFKEVTGRQSLEPTHAVIVFDTLDNAKGELESERRDVESFFANSYEKVALPISLAVVGNSGVSVGDASADSRTLRARVKTLRLTSQLNERDENSSAYDARGNMLDLTNSREERDGEIVRDHRLTNLNRRFTAAVPALLNLVLAQENLRGRCLLLWLGRGWPLLTNTEFLLDSAHTRASYFQMIVALTNAIREGQVTVYNVSSPHLSGGDRMKYLAFLPAVRSAEEAKAGDLSLQVLSVQSGGSVFDSNENVAQEILGCLDEADSFYTLAFDAQPSVARDEYHSLRVAAVGRPELVVKSNTGYYNEP